MDSLPECFTFRYYSVNASRQLGARLNEVPLERSILVDFAAFHPDSLNGKLNGTREENMPGSHNGRNTKQVVLKDLSDVLPEIYTYLHRWVVTLVSVRTVSLYSHLFTPPRALGGGGGGVNPSSPFPILQVCRTASKTGFFFV